jgi:hypothetical protein
MQVSSLESFVTVNEAVCHQLAELLRANLVPDDTEEIKFEGFASDELSNLLLFVVAICHQTSAPGRMPLGGVVDGRELRGWDYLLQRCVEACRSDKSWLSPAKWSHIDTDSLRELYRNSEGQDLLTDIENRAELVKDLGQVMEQERWASAESIFRRCEGRISSGQPNLIECLAKFCAYSDPVRKKSYFFLALMRNNGLWSYQDPELLGAPVDYHEVRGHLRIGTVSVLDKQLRTKLLNREPVTAEEDIAIRNAVFEAIMLVSKVSGIRNPSKLHYLFWNILRNFCTRENPNCLGHRVEAYLPERYRQFALDVNDKEACPFNSVCRSVHEEHRYYEHVFETDYY